MNRLFASAAVLALIAASPALATERPSQDCNGVGNCTTDNSTHNAGGTGVGVGVGKGGDAQSSAVAGAAAVGLNSNTNSAGASSQGASASQSVTGERTQYDSFAFGYAAPGLSIHNNGVYGDGTVTTPYGFQVPAIGGGWNGTDVEPTVGFVWANLPAFTRAFFEAVSDTPEQRDQSTMVRAFACQYVPKMVDQLGHATPYRCN